jgi:hypothetical protein
MILGFTQLVRGRISENLSGGKVRPARMSDNLTTICEPIV